MDKILFIDGHNFIWRANVAFGKPVNHIICADPSCLHKKNGVKHCQCDTLWDDAQSKCFGQLYYIVFNFFRNLRPIIEQFTPDKCFFALEGHSKFRYDLYPEYKANRIIKIASKQDSMVSFNEQRDIIVDLLRYLPITVLRASDYEADDVIATIALALPDEDVTIISNDTDYIQLLQVSTNIKIYNPFSKKYLEAPDYHYIGWKALAGDKSDNIKGLMGDKTAQKMLKDPDKFQTFIAVEENRANFSINRQLIEFQSVPLDHINTVSNTADWLSLWNAFSAMDFQSIINEKSWERYIETFQSIKY